MTLSRAPSNAARARRRAILVLALCAGALGVPAAHGATCDNLPPPEIVLTPVLAAPTVDTSLDLAGLRASSHFGDSQHGASGHLLGLTTANLIGSFEDVIAFAAAPAGAPPGTGFCGGLKELRLRVGFENITIHVAREVTGDRCLYDQVQQHEGRHVQVDREVLAQYGPRVAVNMRAQVAALGMVRGASPDAVRLAIRQRVETAFAAEINGFAQEMRRRQRFVDRPEEYRRLALVCGGVAGRLIAASRRPPAD